jgi:hypothetical protein
MVPRKCIGSNQSAMVAPHCLRSSPPLTPWCDHCDATAAATTPINARVLGHGVIKSLRTVHDEIDAAVGFRLYG